MQKFKKYQFISCEMAERVTDTYEMFARSTVEISEAEKNLWENKESIVNKENMFFKNVFENIEYGKREINYGKYTEEKIYNDDILSKTFFKKEKEYLESIKNVSANPIFEITEDFIDKLDFKGAWLVLKTFNDLLDEYLPFKNYLFNFLRDQTEYLEENPLNTQMMSAEIGKVFKFDFYGEEGTGIAHFNSWSDHCSFFLELGVTIDYVNKKGIPGEDKRSDWKPDWTDKLHRPFPADHQHYYGKKDEYWNGKSAIAREIYKKKLIILHEIGHMFCMILENNSISQGYWENDFDIINEIIGQNYESFKAMIKVYEEKTDHEKDIFVSSYSDGNSYEFFAEAACCVFDKDISDEAKKKYKVIREKMESCFKNFNSKYTTLF